MPLISVVIPAFCSPARHGTSRLRLTLTGYAHQDLPADYEVIVVDDGSEIVLVDEIAGWRLPRPVTVHRQANSGIATAYNAGISLAQAPLILLGLEDEVPSPQLLKAHVAVHADRPNQVVFGRSRVMFHTILFNDVTTGELVPQRDTMDSIDWLVAAVRVLGYARRPITAEDVTGNFDSLLAMATLSPFFEDVERVLASGICHQLRVGWLAMRAGNHSIATDLVRSLGGFDENFDQHGGRYSDVEFGLRLQAAGAEFRLAEEAMSVTLNHRGGDAGENMISGLAYLYAKHRRIDVALCPAYFERGMSLAGFTQALARAARWWPHDSPAGQLR
jgi:glycosyltransferase involved in cell wall biosynthesis